MPHPEARKPGAQGPEAAEASGHQGRRTSRRHAEPRARSATAARCMPLRPKAAHAGDRQAALRGEAGLRQLLFQPLNRDRVWKAWTARGDFTSLDEPWTLAGPLEPAASSASSLPTATSSLKLPSRRVEVDGHRRDRLVAGARPAAAACLPALYLWRRLAVGRAGQLRRGLLPRHRSAARPAEPLDVLVGFHGGVECRF